MELRDTTTPPFTTTPYLIRHPEQKQALQENIKRFQKLGIIEERQSDWRLSLFVVKQKIKEELRKQGGWQQQWRVV